MLLAKRGIIWSIISVAVFSNNFVCAQNNAVSEFFPEIQVLESAGPAEGYFFMGSKGLTAENASHYIAIIDNYGTPVFFRKLNKPTSSFRLLHDGRMAYLHGKPRKLYFLNKMLEVEDTLKIQGFKPNGHDWTVSEYGNVLLMGESVSTVDMSQIVEGGNVAAEILDLVVQEFDKDLNLIYTWNSADHFEITDGDENSSYVDFTEKQIDYVHANGISVDSDTSFLISSRHMNEITKVDRRTADIIWRLGGKKNQFQFIGDDLRFSHQHSIRSLENGNILLFDNGNFRSPEFSSAVEYSIDETNNTAILVKRYIRSPEVYSNHQGATQRVQNGNTVVNWGPYWPSITEFHDDGTPALEWDFTKHSFCPKIEKYKWQTTVFETSSTIIDFGNWESDTLIQKIWVKNNMPTDLIINQVETRTHYFNTGNELPFVVNALDSIEMSIWFCPEDSETGYLTDVLTIASDSDTERIARQVEVKGQKYESVSPKAILLSDAMYYPVDEKIQIQLSEPVRNDGGIELDYNNIDSYIIFKKDGIEGENIDFNATISSDKKLITIYPDKVLEEESIYYVSLKSGLTDYAGNALQPFETTVQTIFTGVTVNKTDEDGIVLYPNPTSSVLKLEVDNNLGEYSYKLINATGVLVRENNVGSESRITQLNLSALSNGIYFLVINTNEKHITKKILKH